MLDSFSALVSPKRLVLGLALAALAMACAAGGLFLFSGLPVPLFPDDYSPVIEDADGRMLKVYLNRRGQWHLPPEGRAGRAVPAVLETCVLEFEDRWFYRHPGVNPYAMARAALQNWSAGGLQSGASTLTMQLARLASPKARTLLNKLREAAAALLLELTLDKREIFRLYLEHAPYGGNVVGYRAACRRYFGKEPEALTWAEAAVLAVLPNAPRSIHPESAAGTLQEKRDRLLARLLARGAIDGRVHEAAVRESIPQAGRPFPDEAPHLADAARRFMTSTYSPLRTTVRLAEQRLVGDLVRRHAAWLEQEGIRNAAALVAETATGRIRAYVGSADYYDAGRNGVIDGLAALRSYGSLLKPFLYALAIDEGQLLPETRLKDIPTWYGAFSPSNAGEKYAGLISAREALLFSLNVPAVRVLNAYGLGEFFLFLKSAGLTHLFRRAADYGLPLILGGGEASPMEIAGLYRGLGRLGRFAPVSFLPGPERETPLISPGAAWLTLEMLKDVQRPGVESYWESFAGRGALAWKTGTSYGQRDAWAAGVSPEWTIVVWAGNFTGGENPNLKSTSSAGFLLFDIFNALSAEKPGSWFQPPLESLTPVEACRATGYRAGPDCPERITLLGPRGFKPLAECPYHRGIYVTLDGRFRVDSRSREEGKYRRVSWLVYPPDVAQFMRAAGAPAAPLPPPAPGLQDDEPALAILYPQNKARFFLPRELDGSLQKLALRAAHRDGRRRLFWYADEVYLGATVDNHVIFRSFERGPHTLSVVDDQGGRASVEFYTDLKEEKR